MKRTSYQSILETLNQAKALYIRNHLYKFDGMQLKYVWHLIMPCLPLFLYTSLSYLDVFSEHEGQASKAIIISSGITFYYLFSETLVGVSNCISQNKGYLFKTGISLSSCYISALLAVYSNFIIRYSILFILLNLYDTFLWDGYLLAAVFSILPVLLAFSIAIWLSVFSIFYKDIENVVQTISFYFLFASGVFSQIDGDSLIERIVSNSPTYLLVLAERNLLLGNPILHDFKLILIFSTASLFLFILGIIALRNSKSLMFNYLR